jgi:hypothetical protein
MFLGLLDPNPDPVRGMNPDQDPSRSGCTAVPTPYLHDCDLLVVSSGTCPVILDPYHVDHVLPGLRVGGHAEPGPSSPLHPPTAVAALCILLFLLLHKYRPKETLRHMTITEDTEAHRKKHCGYVWLMYRTKEICLLIEEKWWLNKKR